MLSHIFFYSFLTAVILQCLYLLIFTIGLLNHRNPTPNSSHGVSVIIAAHNEAENLQKLIPQLLAQRHENFEIIIVDDRSTDTTRPMIENFIAHYSTRLKVIHIERCPPDIQPKKNALTVGIAAAVNEVLLFTDADCLPISTDWISLMTDVHSPETEIVIGYGSYSKKPGFLNVLIQYETLISTLQFVSFHAFGLHYMATGRNLSYRKSHFIKHGGFSSHASCVGGDDDLQIQQMATPKNVQIQLHKKSSTKSEPKQSLSSWLLQKKRHLNAGKKYKNSYKTLLGLYSLSMLIMYVSLGGLFIQGNVDMWIIISFLLRTTLLFSSFTIALFKLDERKFSLFALPVLDLLYFIYLMFTSGWVLFSKSIKWK